MTEPLILWATRHRDLASRTALGVKDSDDKSEETINYWLGRRDALNALLTLLKASPLAEPPE